MNWVEIFAVLFQQENHKKHEKRESGNDNMFPVLKAPNKMNREDAKVAKGTKTKSWAKRFTP